METSLYNSSAYALLFLRSVDVPIQHALAGTGLSEEALRQQDQISSVQMARILHNLQDAGLAPGWAARTGTSLGVSAHGPLGFAALSAPTLGDALRVMAELQAVRITSVRADLQQVDNYCRFALSDLSGDRQFGLWLCEAILKVIETLVETIVGHSLGNNGIISFACPAHDYVAALREIYHARCEFDAPYTALTLPASWQHIPSPLYDEASYRSNIAKCREIINAQSRSKEPVDRVRTALTRYFDRAIAGETAGTAPPGLEQLADALHITPRTLIRHLKQRDTSYKALLEQLRKHYAEELLRRSPLPVAEIAYVLGYREPANFGRAFRRWYGTSPAAWRHAQAASRGRGNSSSPGGNF